VTERLQLAARRERADLLEAPISAFESETQAVIEATSPPRERAILQVLAAMVVVAVLLMAVVKLDRVVAGGGRILPTQGALFLQPLDRSIVTGIVAHSGDVVRKGDVLATLDPTFAQADLTDLQQKRASARALVARLQAESEGRAYLGDATSSDSVMQAAVFAQRRAEYLHTINDFDARVRSASSAVLRNQQDAANFQ
jgi:multidrug efflux pump subunit AcrA (membrane-fusion protein)